MNLLKSRLILTLVWYLVLQISAVCSHKFYYDKSNPPSVPNMAEYFQSFLKGLQDPSKLNLNPQLVESVSEDCVTHLTAMLGNEWSLPMFDAMSKIPEGIFSGHTSSLGDFDECLAVRGELEVSEGIVSTFKGQYCLASFLPAESCQELEAGSKPKLLQVGEARGPILPALIAGGALCVPSKCSTQEVQTVLLATTNITGFCIGVSDCQTDDRPEMRAGDIAMIVILGVIAALCIVGTTFDLSINRGNNPTKIHSKALGAIIGFSVYTNTIKWLNTSGGSDNLGCIHGIRFLSTCWVVLCHTWSTWMVKVWNILDLVSTYEDWTIYPILNGSVSVDTFFTLAGLLAAYTVLKMLDKTKGRLNVPMLYLHRYLRLTPTYAILVGIMATLFEHVRPGPQTPVFAGAAEACRKNWWHNLLYINNLITYPERDGVCHGETWYLGNDMQFFLLSPLLLWPLWKWRRVGTIILAGFTVASVVVPFTVTYIDELSPTLLLLAGNPMDFLDKSYTKPWMRFGPYVAGLWAGYILYLVRKRENPVKLPALVVLGGWALSTATALAIIFGPRPFFEPFVEFDRLNAALYAGFHRFAWGVVISWIVLACTMGYGGIINTFLSWKVFIPLGRLSFCVYLISYWLQSLYYFSGRQHTSYDLYTGINHFFGHMVMSLLVSFVACMAFESPFIALEKIIFQEDSKSKKRPDQNLHVKEEETNCNENEKQEEASNTKV